MVLWDNNSGEYDLSCFRDRFDLTLRDFWKIIPIERMIRDRHRLRLLSGRCIGKRTQTDPLGSPSHPPELPSRKQETV